MDINKIAKEMTREEFLESEYVIDKDEEDEEKDFIYYKCPNNYGLKESDCYCICGECWENAIKDIKFKGDVNVEFDWERFKNNKFVVLCDTEEKAKDFLKECDKRGLSWSGGKPVENHIYYKDYDTCYTYNFNNCEHLQYSSKSFYLDNGYKIIEWEIENKIDYDREYNIMEIMEFPVETEFINEDLYIVKFKEGILQVKNKTKNSLDSWSKCLITPNWLRAEFKLVKKDKKVSFSEAMEGLQQGKIIRCDLLGVAEYYSLEDKTHSYVIGKKKILNGEWYIKEEC
ncbi:hypothetical protein EXQ42_09590 [Clostridium botulinum]|nr:hypothetical protein [Clostridium botulinum]MBO0575120.1 hypothetical protein [Clostridium botulinum]